MQQTASELALERLWRGDSTRLGIALDATRPGRHGLRIKHGKHQSHVQADPHDFPVDLEAALTTVVGIRSEIPSDGYTAELLGTERSGNGIIIRPNGVVLTVGYLVAEAHTVWVTMQNGDVFPGHVLAYDFETGFGLVQILARVELAATPFGSGSEVAIGSDVLVAGAGGSDQQIVATIVARQEFAGYWEYAIDEALFTAPAHPNWGGTGVINLSGELIGIGSLLVQGTGEGNETEDLNMVIPIDLLKPRLEQLLATGRPEGDPRPWLGLFATQLSNRIVVMSVAPYGPAAASNLQQGDILLQVGDHPITSLGDCFRAIWSEGPAGTEIPLHIYRDGEQRLIKVVSADRHDFLRTPTAH